MALSRKLAAVLAGLPAGRLTKWLVLAAWLAVVGFLFLVALGVDYNIFLVSRMHQELTRHGHHAAVTHALTATGGVITSAGVVLAATFATLALAPFVAFVEIGVTVAIGVLLDTTLVRSILVPALALDIGRRFWWPSRLALTGPPDLGAELLPEPTLAAKIADDERV